MAYPSLVGPFVSTLKTPLLTYRRIIGSCTAYIEEIVTDDERIKNLGMTPIFRSTVSDQSTDVTEIPDPNWRQFRLTVGAPDAEAKFKKEVEAAARKDANAAKYPALYVRPVPYSH